MPASRGSQSEGLAPSEFLMSDCQRGRFELMILMLRNLTGNRSWSFSTSARGISCESMRSWWRAARSYRIPR